MTTFDLASASGWAKFAGWYDPALPETPVTAPVSGLERSGWFDFEFTVKPGGLGAELGTGCNGQVTSQIGALSGEPGQTVATRRQLTVSDCGDGSTPTLAIWSRPEPPPPDTYAGAVFVPFVLATVTWIVNIVTGAVTFNGVTPGSTVTRTDPVHGAVEVEVVDNGDGTATATDPWPPLNSDVEYTITEPDGTVTTIVVDTTVDGPDGPGSEPLPRLSVLSQPALELPPVTLIEYTGAYPARNTVHDILDRTDPVVVQREPGLRRGELTYVFDDHGAAMEIADAYRTGAKISLRQATHDRLDVVHIATGDVQITPEHGGLAWRLRVTYTEVAP